MSAMQMKHIKMCVCRLMAEGGESECLFNYVLLLLHSCHSVGFKRILLAAAMQTEIEWPMGGGRVVSR